VNRRATRLGAVVSAMALTLAVSGCGRDDDEKGATPGVTEDPCPNAVDEDKGCIYLGVISDLTGPFKGVGEQFTAGQKAFWANVNANGGIGDYEVDVESHIKDSTYDPDKHAAAYAEIKDDVAAIAQSLGTGQTNAILSAAKNENMLIAPASLGSNWIFDDNVAEIGASYCAEAMNVVDYAVDTLGAKSVAAIHFQGDYGDDAMVGARIAAEARGIKFTEITTGPVDGGDDQKAAVQALIKAKPDLTLISTGPKEMATIIGTAYAGGFTGKYVGSIPTWNAAVVAKASPAAPAIEALYLQATSFPTWESESPGAAALREAVGADAVPNDWFFLGWAGSYVMKAALEKAVENDDLSRKGILDASLELTEVDSEGMLPAGSGNYAGDPNEAAVRSTQLNKVDQTAASKVSVAVESFTGPTAKAYDFTEPCYLQK
jgi:ABC-type branched-subunit amino acid transport system substrate-binding protein